MEFSISSQDQASEFLDSLHSQEQVLELAQIYMLSQQGVANRHSSSKHDIHLHVCYAAHASPYLLTPPHLAVESNHCR